MVRSWALYLGIPIGPGGHLRVWDDIAPRFHHRIRHARCLGLGLALSAVSFRVMCVSLLAF
eukprot:4994022-Pyramimonas_sp.AAC.1